jgi:2-dehydro-3-deoxyphosphogluconate aldolase / (4S)-4-hydroxy-2-oxoglutarate aldolase
MHALLAQIELLGIVPVVVIDDAADAPGVAGALEEGGLPCAEVTFRTAAAAKAIGAIVRSRPGMLVGAGTVLTVEQAQTALDAGARFIVSPGLNRKVVEYCLSKSVPVLPGVATPSDVEAALEYGLEAVKFFPAEAAGGLDFLKAISAPYRTMRFVPTGGIGPSNLLSYLRFPRVLACGGSWMVNPELISAKNFAEIRRLTEDAVRLMLGFELRHVGINNNSPEEAAAGAALMSALLGWPVRDGSSSIFVGSGFEFTKKPFPGAHGHLAIGTNFARRAQAYLERRGESFRIETATEKDGKLISVYLQQEVGGFALHLLQL